MATNQLDQAITATFGRLKEGREKFIPSLTPREAGSVVRVSAGIVKVSGLPGAGFEELLEFPGNVFGIAYNIDENEIGAILLGEDSLLHVGDEVERTGRVMDIPVGQSLIGRVINPLGDRQTGKTALPIIETEAQDISAYIPTNLISITDGQIYLSPKLFELGILPAVDIGKSVSRVGGKAQLPAYRSITGNLKLAYSQFEELETFSRSNGTKSKQIEMDTLDNYSLLMQVADRPSIYYGYIRINYNNTSKITLAKDAWPIVNSIRKQGRAADIKEMQEASGQGKVITDLTEIFRAAKEGRGDLLIVNDDFYQSVKMTGEFSFDLVDDATLPGTTDDITSDIAWEVISKKGRAIFTNQKELESLGEIALKIRY